MTNRSFLVLLATLGLAASVVAQTSATATVPLAVRIPGSISLSLHSTPVAVQVQNGVGTQFQVPLTVQWNLNPQEVPGFTVAAYFRDPYAALAEPVTGTTVAAGELEARWGEGQFQPFQADASTILFQAAIQQDSRRGQKTQTLELKIADQAMPTLPDGTYQGVLYLEVRNY